MRYHRAIFVRPCYRTRNGKRHAYWALVESQRTAQGPRQRVVAYLGQLDESGRLEIKQAAEGQSATTSQQQTLFPEPEPEWVEVDAKGVRVENCRQFGGPWLALELTKTLGLEKFLTQNLSSGREDVPWSVMALVLVNRVEETRSRPRLGDTQRGLLLVTHQLE